MGAGRWRERAFRGPDGELAYAEAGAGPPVVFLSGGPGLGERVMRPLAAPLADTYRCVLPDARGCGRSPLAVLDAAGLHVDRLIADLEALRGYLGADRLTLVGWSWGAMLALLYGAAHPGRVARLGGLGTGPLLHALIPVYAANLLRPLTAGERARHTDLRARLNAALAGGRGGVPRGA